MENFLQALAKRLTKYLKLRKSALLQVRGDNAILTTKQRGVMLSSSKHGGWGISAHTLRQAQGDNAVFVVLIFLFCALSSFNALAQAVNNDTSKGKYPPAFIPGHPLIVVDGRPFDFDSLKNIQAGDIVAKDTLKTISNKNVYVNKADYGAIIIVTKQGAIRAYQKKFSSFSKEYKSYLQSHPNKDKHCLYVLNGYPLDEKLNEGIKKLYDIPLKKIRDVTFADSGVILNSVKPVLLIRTKK